MDFFEDIRLVIFDLDDTFWYGIIAEASIDLPDTHRIIPETLARRGIVCSICSKNDLATVQAELTRAGVWDWFVLPAISWDYKSSAIIALLESTGLRPQSVLFIDDNHINREEVRAAIPAINIADETIVPLLLEHAQLRGKPDPELKRFQRYKLLEQKTVDAKQADDPIEFLRDCDIRVSFHSDILGEFDRVHELVNRTNQLNFTRNRWSEDIEQARREYIAATEKSYAAHSLYIKVADRYGYHGICGFCEIEYPKVLRHFAFSCRILGMGVEQYVYRTLGFPARRKKHDTVIALSKNASVDWIRIVDNAEQSEETHRISASVSLRGPCELAQSSFYLRTAFDVIEEHAYPFKQWAIIRPLVRYLNLADEFRAAKISTPKHLGLPRNFPGLRMDALGCAFCDGETDIGIFSFSYEFAISCYRHNKTGLIVPFSIAGFDHRDLCTIDPAEIIERHPRINKKDLKALRRNFTYAGRYEENRFRTDLKCLRAKLAALAKPYIVLAGFSDYEMIARDRYRTAAKVNAAVIEELAIDGLMHVVDMNDCVASAAEEIAPNHFSRRVYLDLAARLRETIEAMPRQEEVVAAM